ncbi:MAG: putative toxin-antitoxin system toxin component, PIN family [Candidatus Nanopelagicales bacterium]
MIRVVLDPGVLISALRSRNGTPAELVRRWLDGEMQLVYSTELLRELTDVLARPMFAGRISSDQVGELVTLIRDTGEERADQPSPVPAPPDPKDAYLVPLAVSAGADALISGDRLLLAHRAPGLRVLSPRALWRVLDQLPR